MTALSGGDRLEDRPSPESSVLERPNPAASETPPGARSLDRIFPLPGDATRGRADAGDLAGFLRRHGRRGPRIARQEPLAAGDRLCDRRARAQLFPHARRHADQLRTAPAGGRSARPAGSGASAGEGASRAGAGRLHDRTCAERQAMDRRRVRGAARLACPIRCFRRRLRRWSNCRSATPSRSTGCWRWSSRGRARASSLVSIARPRARPSTRSWPTSRPRGASGWRSWR